MVRPSLTKKQQVTGRVAHQRHLLSVRQHHNTWRNECDMLGPKRVDETRQVINLQNHSIRENVIGFGVHRDRMTGRSSVPE